MQGRLDVNGRWLVVTTLVGMSGIQLGAAAVDRPTVHTAEAVAMLEASAVQLDGNLSERIWTEAPAITGFLQREPTDGAPASFATEAHVAYDKTGLYVAVRAFDPDPARIVAHLSRRDEESPSDWIRVVIDSYHDRRTAYEFAVNPAGVKQDKYWFNDLSTDVTWDAVWDVQVGRDDQGWKAEFRIPFSQLRFDPKAKRDFGFAIVRQIGRLNETSSWPLLSKSATGYVSSFGDLRGVTITERPRRLELLPYSVAQVTTDQTDPDNPLVPASDPDAALGLDLKYALTPGLTLTGTANPDFGQVEADPAVVNLSAFETFFAERRPFFVEGSGIFHFDTNCNDGQCTGLFYSRRIGRAPQREIDEPEDGFVATPNHTSILGAAKVTGRVGAWSIGGLNAVTGDEMATIADGETRSQELAEPLTSYSVIRGRREFADQSSVGFITTATNRRLGTGEDFLANEAYTGGLDWDWRIRRKYSLAGYWSGSTIGGSAAAIDDLQQNGVHEFERPDSQELDYDPTRTRLSGQSGSISVSQIAGERIRFNSSAGFKTPGYDINDLGFLLRADERSFNNWIQFRNDRPSGIFRSRRLNLNQWAGWNFDGDRIFAGENVNGHAIFTNNWQTGAGFNVQHQTFDDRLTRGGPGGYRNPGWSYWQYVSTDNRKPASLQMQGFYWKDQHGSHEWEVNPTVTFRPKQALSLSAGVQYTRNVNDYQWIDNIGENEDRYVFGHLNQTTLGVTARASYTFSPTLSLQLYAQPFVSVGAYTNFRDLTNGRASQYEDRFSAFDYPSDPDYDNPDFNFRSFRTTNVLRWEYKPGSTLFVVWQQGREDEIEQGHFSGARELGRVFSLPSQNVFLVKLAYWLNY